MDRRLFLLAVPSLAAFAPAPEPEWVPKKDVLADIRSRTRWRMPVADLRRAFKGLPITPDKWGLERRSFRNEVVVSFPNTRAVFVFSGTVAADGKEDVPTSSSLVSFSILHPIRAHPKTPFVRPPESVHYRYLKRLHDDYLAGLKSRRVPHEAKSQPGESYLLWQKCASAEGEFAFVYWSNTSPEGVFADAPEKLVAEDIEREHAAASVRTRGRPEKRCGFSLPRRR